MYLIRIACWFIVFVYASASLTTFETVHSGFLGSSFVKITLANEGFGYIFLAIIAFAGFMWVKDWRTFTREVQSLSYSEHLTSSTARVELEREC